MFIYTDKEGREQVAQSGDCIDDAIAAYAVTVPGTRCTYKVRVKRTADAMQRELDEAHASDGHKKKYNDKVIAIVKKYMAPRPMSSCPMRVPSAPRSARWTWIDARAVMLVTHNPHTSDARVVDIPPAAGCTADDAEEQLYGIPSYRAEFTRLIPGGAERTLAPVRAGEVEGARILDAMPKKLPISLPKHVRDWLAGIPATWVSYHADIYAIDPVENYSIRFKSQS